MDNNYLLTFAEQYLAAVAVGSAIVLALASWAGTRAAYVGMAVGFLLLVVFFVNDAISIDFSSLREALVPIAINTVIFGAGWLVAAFGFLQLGAWMRRRRRGPSKSP